MIFSADGSRLAYWAIKEHQWCVMTDEGQCGPAWDAIKGGPMFFGRASNPNGVQIAYAAAKGDSRQLVVDGVPIAHDYDKIATGFANLPTNDGFETLAVRGKSLFRVRYQIDPSAVATAKPSPAAVRELTLAEERGRSHSRCAARSVLPTGASASRRVVFAGDVFGGVRALRSGTRRGAESADRCLLLERNCDDSTQVALMLAKLGYPNVFVFKGGWAEWSTANPT